MFFTARHAPHSPARSALIRGGRVICLILAGLGVYELAAGHATGLNPIDYMIPKGMFKPILKLQLPATLGSDLAGVVVEVGSR